MAIRVIKRKNFKAKLPGDLYAVKAITRVDNAKILLRTPLPTLNDFFCEYFTIREDYVYFSGNYSFKRGVRMWQKLKEYFFPVKYVIEYVTMYEAINNGYCQMPKVQKDKEV